ncbi:MAG: flagellar export protein FliJ [Thiogranum sp.]
MTRSKRMQPVQRVAHSREQNAVQKLGQSQQNLDAQRARLEELRAYRDQYTRDFELSGGGGLDAARIQDYRAFLNRLGEAIRQQEVLIEQCRSQHEQTRQQWIETRSHSQVIDKVVHRYCREEHRQQERKEQQEQDERALRAIKK